MNSITDTLKDRLFDAAHCGNPDKALDYAVGLHLEAASMIEALATFQTECKTLIGEVFVETGQTEASTSMGKVYVTKPSVRITYDSKGLDALAALDEEAAALLEPFRRETAVAGTLTIRATKGNQS